ncbi:MAG: hypothetical protein GY820_18770 [Gammaproteobacteria bacterium]|nr:hypothetical protein [Gammaproteobacteria bacterium]
MGEIWRIPLPGDHWGCAGRFEKPANGPETRNTEQMNAHWENGYGDSISSRFRATRRLKIATK